jgi:hypothetical protein
MGIPNLWALPAASESDAFSVIPKTDTQHPTPETHHSAALPFAGHVYASAD